MKHNPVTYELVKRLLAEQVFHAVHYVDLGQSMDGGGGPACLRLRVPLSEQELARVPTSALWTENRDSDLRDIIRDRYPSELKLSDLVNPEICKRSLETQVLIAKCLGQNSANT